MPPTETPYPLIRITLVSITPEFLIKELSVIDKLQTSPDEWEGGITWPFNSEKVRIDLQQTDFLPAAALAQQFHEAYRQGTLTLERPEYFVPDRQRLPVLIFTDDELHQSIHRAHERGWYYWFGDRCFTTNLIPLPYQQSHKTPPDPNYAWRKWNKFYKKDNPFFFSGAPPTWKPKEDLEPPKINQNGKYWEFF